MVGPTQRGTVILKSPIAVLKLEVMSDPPPLPMGALQHLQVPTFGVVPRGPEASSSLILAILLSL